MKGVKICRGVQPLFNMVNLMERVNNIINNSIYKSSYKLIEDYEKPRIYCRHDMSHFLDVARLSWIFNLEDQLGLSKEIVYAAAMLHDIGKYEQYTKKIPHEIASAQIAKDILQDCGFDESESHMIQSAIESHRDFTIIDSQNLSGVLYRADKMSRNCFLCEANSSCNWDLDKRNMKITY